MTESAVQSPGSEEPAPTPTQHKQAAEASVAKKGVEPQPAESESEDRRRRADALKALSELLATKALDEEAILDALRIRAQTYAGLYRFGVVLTITVGLYLIATKYIEKSFERASEATPAAAQQQASSITTVCNEAQVQAAVTNGVHEAYLTLLDHRVIALESAPKQRPECSGPKARTEIQKLPQPDCHGLAKTSWPPSQAVADDRPAGATPPSKAETQGL